MITKLCLLLVYKLIIQHYSLLSRELQKATSNFTTLLGQGSFGPVYKADMSSGEILAVKVLANNSKQGEKEFQNEVSYCLYMTRNGHVWYVMDK